MKLFTKKDKKLWLAFAIMLIILLTGRTLIKENSYIDIVNTTIALFTVFLLIIELSRDKDISEAQLIIEINNQFIDSSSLAHVERKLEEYVYFYNEYGQIKNDYWEEWEKSLTIGSEARQELVNYLVHLEGVAALVNNNVLTLPVITDLVAYRYFIAVNNPIVQKLELIPCKDYYRGCFKIYTKWEETMIEQKITIPLVDFSLKNTFEEE